MLKRFAAFDVPWRAHSSTASAAGVEQLVEPLPLVRLERRQDVVDEAALRRADPDPQPAELLGARARR